MNQVVQDAFEIAQTLYDSEKGLPYIVLGHSMGSLLHVYLLKLIQILLMD